MLYLWIARHGLTQHNVDGIMQGHYDSDLNEEGRIQAALLAERLEKEVQFDVIFTSPLKRAKDTALAIHRLQPQAQFVIDAAIIERDMGEWNNYKVPRKPKKVKVIEQDPKLDHPDAHGRLIHQHPSDPDQANFPVQRSGQTESEQVNIEQSKADPNLRKEHRCRGISEPPAYSGGYDDAKIPSQVFPYNQSGLSKQSSGYEQHKQAISKVGKNTSDIAQHPVQEKQAKPVHRKIPGMEDRSQVEARCHSWMTNSLRPLWLTSIQSGRDVHLLLVSHGAFISTMLDSLLEPVSKGGWGFVQANPRINHCFNTSITKFAIDGNGTGALLVSNNIDHLEPKATFCDPQDFAHDVIRRKKSIKV